MNDVEQWPALAVRLAPTTAQIPRGIYDARTSGAALWINRRSVARQIARRALEVARPHGVILVCRADLGRLSIEQG